MAELGVGKLPFSLAAGGQKVGRTSIIIVYWFNPSSVGDTFTLTNNEGNVILQGRCEVANQSQWFDFSLMPISVDGVGCAQLSSGTLWVYPS